MGQEPLEILCPVLGCKRRHHTTAGMGVGIRAGLSGGPSKIPIPGGHRHRPTGSVNTLCTDYNQRVLCLRLQSASQLCWVVATDSSRWLTSSSAPMRLCCACLEGGAWVSGGRLCTPKPDAAQQGGGPQGEVLCSHRSPECCHGCPLSWLLLRHGSDTAPQENPESPTARWSYTLCC